MRDEGKKIMENDEREKFIDLSCPRNNKSQSYYQQALFDETSFIKMFLSLRFAIESRWGLRKNILLFNLGFFIDFLSLKVYLLGFEWCLFNVLMWK